MKKFLLLTLFSLAFAYAKPVVIASIAPIAYFVEQIAGDKVEIITLGTGDVHSYEPKPNDMKNISKASIYFAAGLEFEEAWIPRFKANAKDLVVVNTDAKIAKLKEKGEHEAHADPHVWLNPMLALNMSRNILDALIDLDSTNKNFYLENFQNFMDKVIDFDEKATSELKELKNRKFVVYHPAWAYFAAKYDLEQISIEKDGKEPKIDDLAGVIKLIKDNNIKVIFADPNHSQKSAGIIAKSSGAKVELLDPLSKNWLENLELATKAIKNAN